jgi:hypothetical protein
MIRIIIPSSSSYGYKNYKKYDKLYMKCIDQTKNKTIKPLIFTYIYITAVIGSENYTPCTNKDRKRGSILFFLLKIKQAKEP